MTAPLPLTELEIERELFDLHLLPTFVAEPEAPTVPAGSDATGSAALIMEPPAPTPTTPAPAAPPSLSIAEPECKPDAATLQSTLPPGLRVVHNDGRTWTCEWAIDKFDPPIDIDAARAVRKPKAKVTPSGWVPMFKGVNVYGYSSRRALYLPGHVTGDHTGHGLYLSRTPHDALKRASVLCLDAELAVMLVAVRADEITADRSGKVLVPRCYTMTSLSSLDRLTRPEIVHVQQPGTSRSVCGLAAVIRWAVPNCPACLRGESH